jgi:hypothetical protein
MILQPPDSLSHAADQLGAMDVLLRFAAGQDFRDGELFATTFADDAVLDFVQPARRLGATVPVFQGKRQIVDTIMASTAPLKTSHTVTNQRAVLDGPIATLTAWVEAMHVLRADERRRLLLKNIYRCELVRPGALWQARRIVIENVWFEGEPAVLFPGS